MIRFDSKILLACIVSLILAGCEQPVLEKAIRPVRAIKIGDTTSVSGRSLPGRSAAVEEVNLSFRVPGLLVQLPVEVGQEVKLGELLGQVDSTDYRVALDDAQARLDRAEQQLLGMKKGRPEDIRVAEESLNAAQASYNNFEEEFKRNRQLIASKAISQAEYDRSVANLKVAQADVESANENLTKLKAGARVEDVAAQEAELRSLKSAVENAKNQLAYTTLAAPFDGTIASTFVKNFQSVQANQLIVRLVDKSSIEVTISLPEQSIHLVKYVTKINCVFDAFPEKVFDGKIKEVGTEASQSTRTYPVVIAVEQEYASEGITILPGMTCKISGEVELPEEGLANGMEVPETAILDDGTEKYVWIVDPSAKTVSRQPITAGELTPYGILIEGVSAGQWVVTAGVHYLQDGQQVRILGEAGS